MVMLYATEIQSTSNQKPVGIAKKEKVPANTAKQVDKQLKKKKLSYKLQLELDALPRQLEELEAKVATLQESINAPEFFTKNRNEADQFLAELAKTEEQLEIAFMRWEELEELQNGEN